MVLAHGSWACCVLANADGNGRTRGEGFGRLLTSGGVVWRIYGVKRGWKTDLWLFSIPAYLFNLTLG